jgi:hypothetical protein
MRPLAVLIVVFGMLTFSRSAHAQGPPPPIPFWAIDVHATVPSFPNTPALAASRGLQTGELPGATLGIDLAVNIYPLRLRKVTFGLGGRLMSARARSDPQNAPDSGVTLRPVTEQFTYVGPLLSLNFGTGSGWSYLSGGYSTSRWSLIPDGTNVPVLPQNQQSIPTFDYGGGARWFAKPHLAFSFDVRFYAIGLTTPAAGLPSGPRTTLLVVGAGVSFK